MENGIQHEISNKDIYDLLKTVLRKNDEIQKQNDTIKEELKQEIRNINTELFKEIEALKQKSSELEEENRILKVRLLANEKSIKKYNVVIYNLQEHNQKIEEIEFLLKLLHEKLELECRYSDIRDFYRIGKNVEGKIRPVLVEFVNYQLKADILGNAYKLKGTNIYISNDYTSEEYQKRKVLYQHLKKARESNLEATIKNNILIINGDKFTYEDIINQPIAIQQAFEEQQPVSEEENTNANEKQNYSSVNQTREVTEKKVEKEKEVNTSDCSTAQETDNKKRKQQPQDGDTFQKRSTRMKKL